MVVVIIVDVVWQWVNFGYLCWVFWLYCVVVEIIECYGGMVFCDVEVLFVFFGIGDYIVCVVVVFVYGDCYLVVDMNMWWVFVWVIGGQVQFGFFF